MQVHTLGIGGRGDDRRADRAGRADGAEDVGAVVTVVAYHRRARAELRPDIGVPTLLPDSGLVLEPDLDRCRRGAAEQGCFQQRAEVFLKASCAASSLFG